MTIIDRNYQTIELIFESPKILVYRAERISDSQQVIINLIKTDRVDLHELAIDRALELSECSLTLPGEIKVIEFKYYQNDLILVLEDFEGISIKEYFHVLDLPTKLRMTEDDSIDIFLQVAIQIAKILVEFHQNGIIYRDLSLVNIQIDPKNQQVKFKPISYTIRSLLKEALSPIVTQNKNQSIEIDRKISAYVSPEQTQQIDLRSNIYSLGVIFYELLTGKLPFNMASLSAEQSDYHLDNSPLSIDDIGTNVSQILSAIVNKMIAINIEDRYQSAWELQLDLEDCWERRQNIGKIETFELGQKAVSSHFVISHKFYGRTLEIQSLLNSVARIVAPIKDSTVETDSESILISGFFGVGKTALIDEIERQSIGKNAYIIKGRFTELSQSNSSTRDRESNCFSGFVEAFRSLIGQLAISDDDRVAEYKDKILTALGNDGQVIIDVIPELVQIIDRQPPVKYLPERESKLRFNLLFHKLSKVFLTLDRPLIILLEDLQWSDDDSLQLLEVLMQSNKKLLTICTYRDNEFSGINPLMSIVNRLKKIGVIIRTINLSPLSALQIDELVADSFNCHISRVKSFAELIYQKTNGNPFFTIKFLEKLAKDGSIEFNSQLQSWQCDLSHIKIKNLTDDEIELMANKLQQLPLSVQQLLKLAACLERQFDLPTLEIVSQQPEVEVARILYEVLYTGSIVPVQEIYNFGESLPEVNQIDRSIKYQFSHESVRQAICSLIPESELALVHNQIGELILQHILDSEQLDLLREISQDTNVWAENEELLSMAVDRLNYAVELNREPALQQEDLAQRDLLVRLNAIASRQARAAQVYPIALKYARFGLELLDRQAWQQQYDLALTLHQLAIESAALCGEFELMQRWMETAIAQISAPLELVSIYLVQIQSLTSQDLPLAAIDSALSILDRLGVRLPPVPTIGDFEQVMVEIDRVNIDTLFDLPAMTDPHQLAIVEVFVSMMGACYVTNPKLYALIVALQVNLAIQYGNSPSSAYSYAAYGIVINNCRQDVLSAERFSNLAYRLAKQPQSVQIRSETLAAIGLFLHHRKSHLRTTLPIFQMGYQAGLATANLEYVGYHIEGLFSAAYWCGHNLTELQFQFLEYRQKLLDLHQVTTANYCTIYCETVLFLVGNPESVTLNFDLTAAEQLLLASKDLERVFLFYFHRAMLRFLMGDLERANTDVIYARAYLDGVAGSIYEVSFYFYDALIALARVDRSQPESGFDRERVRADRQQLQHWATSAPMNHLHKLHLVAAETCRVSGDKAAAIELYDRAIAGAQRNDYIQEAALANELAAKFYFTWGKDKIAAEYIQAAYTDYARWGALAKIQDLTIRYPSALATLLTPVETTEPVPFPSLSASILDFNTYIRAIEALYSEIDLDRLLRTLMEAIVENSGADKAVLLLNRDGRLTIEFEYDAGELETMDFDLDSFDRLADLGVVDRDIRVPLSLIRQVHRSQQLALHDGIERLAVCDSNRFFLLHDPYFQQHQPQSILCVPIINQGKSIGILYLEHAIASGVFTHDRVELLKIICTQAAISLENARLHQESQANARRLEESLTALQTAMCERQQTEIKLQATNAELSRSNRLKDEFLANMSHELRTPLNAILGMTSGLLAQTFGSLAPAQLNALQTIDLSGTRLLSLINNILDLATIAAGQFAIDCAPIALAPLCELSLRSIDRAAAQKQLRVSSKIQPGLPTVMIDERRICQALSDLLNNAVKFSLAGGQIALEVAYVEEKVRIAVTDTGLGIAPEQIQYLFQPFFQIDGSFKRQFEGTGLGLALVKGIVDLHGGEVGVTSQLGVGSTFTIDLPCEPMPPIAAALNSGLLASDLSPTVTATNASDVNELAMRTPTRLPLILLVDSNQASVNTISSYLKAKGYQMLSTNNARSAIIRLEESVRKRNLEQMPDLILMDMPMSAIDGFETIGQIRKLADLPIIVLSTAATPDNRERCLAAGANEYLPKPVKLKQLTEILRQLLG